MSDPVKDVADLVGHRLAEHNRYLFEEALRKVALATGKTPAEVARAARKRDPIAYRELVAGVTVHETYFFRHPEHFALVSSLAAEAASRNDPLRYAWSVGCSTGEEAYSLAMSLSRHVREFTVAGSDISVEALEVARAGRYGSRSFRVREPHTISEVRQVQGQWEIKDEIRQRMVWSELNLASDRLAPPRPLPPQVGLVFCRNVLIYLQPSCVADVLKGLLECVTPGGLLLLGPLDGPSVAPEGFVMLDGYSACALRRLGPGEKPQPKLPPRPLPPARRAAAPLAPAPSGEADRRGSGHSTAGWPKAPVSDELAQARRLADSGDLTSALERLRRLPQDPDALYLAASIHGERGENDRADLTLRKLLLLRPDYVPAHLQLLLLARRRQDAAGCAHRRDALERLVGGLPPDADLGDGVKVAYVLEVLSDVPASKGAG